ncbi:MAG: putative oxidoreductase EphD [Pseudomonadota bacterium]|nr:SDR family oxidoreductase [Rubrivivax sp.]NLZ42938.1 SDR family oxidoreductase [Comamonadaceae bacterium]
MSPPSHPLAGGVAVVTGAASGFGLEACRIAAGLGMKLVMADVQLDALEAAARALGALGAAVLPWHLDVADGAAVEALGAETIRRFGPPNLVFNNAGVGAGGLVWESSVRDWQWVLGVNLMGVVHGVRVFTPLMLEAERRDRAYRGHIVNTASMAGLVNMPNMGVYSVSKHAVVALSETLYQDLALVSERVHAHLLCPFFVPTGIHRSERNRPADLAAAEPTRSQRTGQAMNDKAVGSGKVSAAQVAQFVFDAVAEGRFYIYSHPKALRSVQTRLEDLVAPRNPSDPFAERPEVGAQLRAALRGG